MYIYIVVCPCTYNSKLYSQNYARLTFSKNGHVRGPEDDMQIENLPKHETSLKNIGPPIRGSVVSYIQKRNCYAPLRKCTGVAVWWRIIKFLNTSVLFFEKNNNDNSLGARPGRAPPKIIP